MLLLQVSKQPSITDHASVISKKKRAIITEKKTNIVEKKAQQSSIPTVRKAQTADPQSTAVEVSQSREIEPGVICTAETAETELRSFDICTRYGPCMSLTRIQRFERAKRFGLNPPDRIKKILEAFPELSSESIWHGRT